MANENLQNYTTSAGSHLRNREIWTGGQTVTWPVPEGTTEVQVHVWGGGGSGTYNPLAGGGGGGYARASLAVTDADSLSITVGGAGGTSSITVPTQTPGSPISATGGTPTGGAGGSGAITLAPSQPTYYCFTASGGAGGTACPTQSFQATGGAAGSPLGPGGDGTGTCNSGAGGIGGSPGQNTFCAQFLTWPCTASPTGAIFGCASVGSGGSWLGGNIQDNYWCPTSGSSNWYPPTTCTWQQCEGMTMVLGSVGCSRFLGTTCVTWPKPCAPTPAGQCTQMGGKTALYDGPKRNTAFNDWFYVEDMGGAAPGWWTIQALGSINCTYGAAGAGAGGGLGPKNDPAGILGGGGVPNGPSAPMAGCAGGSGGSSTPTAPLISGTPGIVMIYW